MTGITMSDLVLLGYIARAFGIGGGVVIKLINQQSDSFAVSKQLLLKWPSGQERAVTVRAIMHGGRVFFDGVLDRTQAEALKGAEVWLNRNDLPKLDDDEFYLTDLLNARVIDMTGAPLGEVIGFASNGPQVLLELKTIAGHVALIPAVKPIIHHIDYAAKIITLDAPNGLLDALD